jgi:hypothetical protein
MVQRASWGNPSRGCFLPSDTGAMPPKTHRLAPATDIFSPRNHSHPRSRSRRLIFVLSGNHRTGSNVAHAPMGDSLLRSMKIVERSKRRRVHSCWETPHQAGLCFRMELRRLRKTQATAYGDTSAAPTAAAATPTHSGRYALPFFPRPPTVAAKLRATFRRASFDDRPCSSHLRYGSANGLSP